MLGSGNDYPSQANLENNRRPGPGQGAEPACRISPGSSATIPVSKGWMPDLVLAHSAVVLENGQADPGTGHTPTGEPGRFRFSITRFWSKFRLETQDSARPTEATAALLPEFRRENKKAADRDTKALCI